MSVGVPTANSSTSVTVMVKVWAAVEPSAMVARTVMLWLAARLAVEQRAVGDGDHAGGGVDGEASAGIVGQRVGDRVGAIGVGRPRR